MGVGDWLMCTAQVRELHARTGKRVRVVNPKGISQWSEVFRNNPKIVHPDEAGAISVRLTNSSGARPYIAAKMPDHWVWRRWNIAPGEIYLTDEERAFGARYAGHILIEPNTKVIGSNKAWVSTRWQEVVDAGGEFVQVGVPGVAPLHGVTFVETPSFRHACAVLAASRCFVGTEGGLHHAAAALNVPAVVLFSEFISPEFTGYPMHRNLRSAGAPCGMRVQCQECRRSMERITVEEVSQNLREVLRACVEG